MMESHSSSDLFAPISNAENGDYGEHAAAPIAAKQVASFVAAGETPVDRRSRLLTALFESSAGCISDGLRARTRARLERILGWKTKRLFEDLRKHHTSLYKHFARGFDIGEVGSTELKEMFVEFVYTTWIPRSQVRITGESSAPCLEIQWINDYVGKRPASAAADGPAVPHVLETGDHRLGISMGPRINAALISQQVPHKGGRFSLQSREEYEALTKTRVLFHDVWLAESMDWHERRRLARAVWSMASLLGPCAMVDQFVGLHPILFPFYVDPEPDLDSDLHQRIMEAPSETGPELATERALCLADLAWFYPGVQLKDVGTRFVESGRIFEDLDAEHAKYRVRLAAESSWHLESVFSQAAAGECWTEFESIPWTKYAQTCSQRARQIEQLDVHHPDIQAWAHEVLTDPWVRVVGIESMIETNAKQLRGVFDQAENQPTMRERAAALQDAVRQEEQIAESIRSDLDQELSRLIPPVLESADPVQDPEPNPTEDEVCEGAVPATASHEEGLQHLEAENDRLRQLLYSAQQENESLRRCVSETPKLPSGESASIRAAVERYLSTERPDDALSLLAAMYPDRVRLLPEATGNETEGLSGEAVLNKVGPLIREGRDLLRDEGMGGRLREVVPAKVSPRESETVACKEKLRAHRRFKDGSHTREIFSHLSLSHSVRLYFEYDADENRIIIGYMGKHLPTGRHTTV